MPRKLLQRNSYLYISNDFGLKRGGEGDKTSRSVLMFKNFNERKQEDRAKVHGVDTLYIYNDIVYVSFMTRTQEQESRKIIKRK